MNLKKINFSILVTLITVSSTFAQFNLLNAKSPDEIGLKTEEQISLDNDKPLEYGYVGDRDILFGKMVWERVDLNQRANFPLLYPIDENNMTADRKSLFTVLIEAVQNGDIKTVYADSYFKEERSMNQIEDVLQFSSITAEGTDYLNDNGYSMEDYENDPSILPEMYKIVETITAADIQEYMIKGFWYFDKRQAEMKYRILAIAPAAPEARFKNSDDEVNKKPIPLFWVFYPSAREVLHKAKAFNNENSSMPFSFDHILNARRFHGYIYREQNVQGDRAIHEYVAEDALMQLLESERIKDKIRDFELDMWTY